MRYFIYLSYDGSQYHGWQIQPNAISVQSVLQDRLSTLLRSSIEIVGAGRTDSGVNASEMVAHFDIDHPISSDSLRSNLNKFLPPDISVYDIVRVNDEAHARFSAIGRTYHYYVSQSKVPMLRSYSYTILHRLDFSLMNAAARLLLEYKDFTSFSKLHTDVKTNNCDVRHAEWRRVSSVPFACSQTDLWVFEIKADRFLRNMVRAIVGTLLDVGRGVLDLDGFREIIEKKDRCSAGMSVPGNALFLSKIDYPREIFKV